MYSGQSPARPGCCLQPGVMSWEEGEGVSSSSSLSVSADWACALPLAWCFSGRWSMKIPYYRSFSQYTIPNIIVILIYTVRFIEVKIYKKAMNSLSVSCYRGVRWSQCICYGKVIGTWVNCMDMAGGRWLQGLPKAGTAVQVLCFYYCH